METLGVAMIGYKFMGKVHSRAYRDAIGLFDPKVRPEPRVICGRDETGVRNAAARYGWQEYSTNWEEVVERDDIQIIDISVPGDMHRPIALAAARHGKHILCEKPLANSLPDALVMAQAVETANVVNMVSFNYRRVPAVVLARELIEAGEVGEVYHWRGCWLSDWGTNPEVPITWRFQRERAGSGSLGDLGSHLIDLAHYLIGPIEKSIGLTETFIKERPLLPSEQTSGHTTGAVNVDDGALFLARFENGAIGSFEATRFAGGSRERFIFEINGSRGSLYFDFERLNELRFFSWREPARTQGYRTIFVGQNDHPYGSRWWPPGLGIGYDAAFVHTVYDFLNGVAERKSPSPDFREAVGVQAVLETVSQSIEEERWVKVSDVLDETSGPTDKSRNA